jgi:hypothetical protein
VWAFLVSFIILYTINKIPGLHLRQSEEDETRGGDMAEMGEVRSNTNACAVVTFHSSLYRLDTCCQHWRTQCINRCQFQLSTIPCILSLNVAPASRIGIRDYDNVNNQAERAKQTEVFEVNTKAKNSLLCIRKKPHSLTHSLTHSVVSRSAFSVWSDDGHVSHASWERQ